jgi:sigma-E factor negative regulatory protein RseA
MMSDKISALLDGEFEEDQALEAVRAALSSNSAIKSTRDYQLIGDAMRGEQALSVDLAQSIMDKINLEPTILSPNAIKTVDKAHGQNRSTDNGSNLSQRLPQSWSIAASVAAVMAVGLFMMYQQQSGQESQITPNMAIAMHSPGASNNVSASVDETAQTPSIPMAYLKAHRISVPSVGSHYIQTVNFSE